MGLRAGDRASVAGLPERAASGPEAPRSRCSSRGGDPTSPPGFAQKITPASSRSIFIVQGGPSAHHDFVGFVGDLARLTLAHSGRRKEAEPVT